MEGDFRDILYFIEIIVEFVCIQLENFHGLSIHKVGMGCLNLNFVEVNNFLGDSSLSS